MSLYHKYRPSDFDGVYGNEDTVEALKKALESDDPPHVYLFHGPTGCGKTTLGRITARKLGCVGRDYCEVDASDFRGIDTIRDIRRQAVYQPLEGKCRVWLLDECHNWLRPAASAMLKALEDTPPHVFYILCTTDPQRLLPAIRNRCAEFSVKPLSDKEMMRLLRAVVREEGGRLPRSVFEQIIETSKGSGRHALQILERVLQADPERQVELARQSADEQAQVIELCRALIDGSPWKKVSIILSGLKDQEPESIRRAVLGYCSAVLLKGENDRAGVVLDEFISPFYDSGFPGLVMACYSIIRGD